MASTFSTNLALELIGTGDQAGTWGITTNTNLGTLIEQAISGYVTQAVATGTDTTITIPDGATGVARNMYIELTGTGGASTNLIVPANKKLYFIFNNSTGAVTVKVSGQTGVSVPAGKKMVLVSNGTDIVNAANYVADFGSNSATITQLTSTSATITNLTLTSLALSNLSIASANVTTLTSASATITNLLATSLTVSGNTFLATSSGNVGIGTSSPSQKLTVAGAINLSADATNPNSGVSLWSQAGIGATLSGFNVAFNTGSNGAQTEKMRLDSSGNLGIGTSSPSFLLHASTSSAAGTVTSGVRNTAADGNTRFALGNNAGVARATISLNNNSDEKLTIGPEGSFPMLFQTNGTERMRLDSSGNLGLGVTPSAWWSSFKAMQVGTYAGIASGSGVSNYFNNAFFDGTNFKYLNTATAAWFQQDGNEHKWYNAPSGTAGNNITFTQAMTLTADGNLAVGTTTIATPATDVLTVGKNSGTWDATLVVRQFANNTAALLQLVAANDTGAAFNQISSSTSGGTQHWRLGGIGGFTGGLAISTSGSERARIDSSGNFGIGNTSPGSYDADMRNLVVGTSGTTGISIISGTSSNGTLAFGDGTGAANYRGYVQYNHTSDYLVFGTAATERARITSGGDLLVNTATSYGRVTVQTVDGSAAIGTIVSTAVNYNALDFRNSAGTQCGRILVNNAVTTEYLSASDRRLKENIAPADDAGSVIDSIEVVKHDWKVGGHVRFGVIAQDLHVVAPEAVGTGDADDVEELQQPWGVDYSKLVPMLIKEVQSLRKRVAELEAK